MRYLLFLSLLVSINGCRTGNDPVRSSSLDSDYKKGDSLYKKNNDSAFYYYNKVANNSNDRIEKANAYNRMAMILFNSGDHFGSQEVLIEALKLLDEKSKDDYPYLLPNYNLLGRSYLEQKNYDAAITSFRKALNFLKPGQFIPKLNNNLAVAYQKKKDFIQAKNLFKTALDSSTKDSSAYAMALSNYARTKWLENSSYSAAPELLEALKIREAQNDQTGLIASYSHLADYYHKTNPDSSYYYANKMYYVAQSPNDILEAIEKITRTGSPNDIKEYTSIYFKLNDSIKQAGITTKNQLAAIRFETEKNKSDNLRLQRDNIKQRVYLYLTIAGFLILTVFGMAWYRRRKQKLEIKAQESIREYQLQTSKKVHDVVANGLYQIMNELEHREEIEKEPLLDKIEVLYEQSRDISYNKPQNKSVSYSVHIEHLLNSFASTDINISIKGNKDSLWSRFTMQEKKEIEYVLQEFMVNMSKHSQAKNVKIGFTEEKYYTRIEYTDDGTGFFAGFQSGNGLRNAENRIKNLGGSIIFDGIKGLNIKILLPKSKADD